MPHTTREQQDPIASRCRLDLDVHPHYRLLRSVQRRVQDDPRGRFPVLTIDGQSGTERIVVVLRLTPDLSEKLTFASRVPVGFLNVAVEGPCTVAFSLPLPSLGS